MRLYCRTCGLQLTRKLEKLKDGCVLCKEDGKDLLPKGFYFIHDGTYYAGFDGQITVNKHEGIHLKDHSDIKRLNGCCGLDGCDGMNQVCENGHEVATLKADCWMAHALLFDHDCVDQSKD